MSPPTIPAPPPIEVIPAGQARSVLLAAIANYAAASARLIAVADALVRQADLSSEKTP